MLDMRNEGEMSGFLKANNRVSSPVAVAVPGDGALGSSRVDEF